ncbi:MAG: Hydroxyacylglutathione hydrolase [Nitrospirae bacterium]|nr:Hydroxyacylglutathione hydrolase [Nitrospirota bacterium]MCE7963875.1 MBL fold metallo-hydrolase [Nitrospira sp. NTP2]MCK6494277.1 MBL fold metallo-hydrolase [Nitrospira sp.]MEB2339273.1 MBL fold metallo-hydrolase [Nitrospirales bacterium]NUN69289.1 MBL fold metallo-hydrolase [Bacteroidota bacterium]
MPLEDELSDIIKKARLGRQRSVAEVARAAGLVEEDLAELERGRAPSGAAQVASVAKALGLKPDALVEVAQGWTPEAQPASTAHVETVLGSIGGYEVKGYVVHDRGEAILVDTAYNPDAMLALLTSRQLTLRAICLTHGHSDHAEGIERILRTRPVPVYLGPEDLNLLHWRPPQDILQVPRNGESLQVGGLTVRFMTTPGHTPGGICYRAEQAGQPLCFVGDTLFAGSIGRSNPAGLYAAHLDSVRRQVLTLEADTRLHPGHGPSTTVREELVHNPFAA